MKETIKHYTVKIHNTKIGSGGFRAAFLSDMHDRVWRNDVNYLVSVIEDENPDIIFCGGDMVVGHPSYKEENLLKAGSFLKKISERHTVYYAFGNHEYRLKIYPETYGDMYKTYMEYLEDSNIVWLDNDSVKIEVNRVPVSIYGLSIARRYYRRFSRTSLPVQFINNALGRPDKSSVSILLAHHPKYLASYFKWGADIILSGHYHGGVMQLKNNKGLISPDPSVFPHTAYGCIQRNSQTAVISAGMGEHTIPVRINNPREIVIFDAEIW